MYLVYTCTFFLCGWGKDVASNTHTRIDPTQPPLPCLPNTSPSKNHKTQPHKINQHNHRWSGRWRTRRTAWWPCRAISSRPCSCCGGSARQELYIHTYIYNIYSIIYNIIYIYMHIFFVGGGFIPPPSSIHPITYSHHHTKTKTHRAATPSWPSFSPSASARRTTPARATTRPACARRAAPTPTP